MPFCRTGRLGRPEHINNTIQLRVKGPNEIRLCGTCFLTSTVVTKHMNAASVFHQLILSHLLLRK